LKYLQQCVEDYNTAIQLGMFDANIFFARAIVYEEFCRYEEAISDFELSLALNPNQDDVYGHIGKAFCENLLDKRYL
jgi:tetratricopeptide (TPR) repeat protein